LKTRYARLEVSCCVDWTYRPTSVDLTLLVACAIIVLRIVTSLFVTLFEIDRSHTDVERQISCTETVGLYACYSYCSLACIQFVLQQLKVTFRVTRTRSL